MEEKQYQAEDAQGLFFPGCALEQQTPELSTLIYSWLKQHRIVEAKSRACCGKPLEYQGLDEIYEQTSTSLLQRLLKQGYTQIITACPNCYYSLKNVSSRINSRIEILALPDLLLRKGIRFEREALPSNAVLTVHDSCPDRQELIFGSALRTMLGDIPYREMEHAKERSLCCGIGDVFYRVSADLQNEQADRRLAEAEDIKATHMLSPCINCARVFNARDTDVQAIHYLELMFYRDLKNMTRAQHLL